MVDFNWQERTELLFGENKIERIRNANVLVVGTGGVGYVRHRKGSGSRTFPLFSRR